MTNADTSTSTTSSVESGKKEEEEERASWGGQIEFILTCVGYAVGLGNIWRFPYLCYKNGGGAFLIPYFGMLAFVGLPLFFMELSFGQFASLGPITIWSINPFMKGLGYSMVITNTLIFIYYNVIISWCIYYFFASMASEVPWADCGNPWNSPYCVPTADMKSLNFSVNNTVEMNNMTVHKSDLKSPSDEYFYDNVLQLSDGIEEMGTIVWQLSLTLLLAWIIVFFVLIKGISSLGKVVYFTSTFPYVLLTIMLIRGVTLEGAYEGIKFYLKPDFSKLANAQVWSDAATQIFFSLSTCTGGLIAMSSYSKFKNNCHRDAVIVPLINCGTSFYGGFAIFSVLGYMAHTKGVSVDEVAASGPGLVFVVYPEGLATMPVAPLWSILFFLMMMILGLSSMFSMAECFFCALMDEFPSLLRKTRTRTIVFRIVGTIVFYLIGLCMVTEGGFYLFNIFDVYLSGFPLLIIGLAECCTLMFVYGYSNFAEDIKMMIGKKPNIYFRVTWLFCSPVILLATTIFLCVEYTRPTLFSGEYHYPSWADAIGWMLVVFCLVFIPIMAIIALFQKGCHHVIKDANSPTAAWGPSAKEDRTGRYAPLEVQSPEGVTIVGEAPNYTPYTGFENTGWQNSDDKPPKIMELGPQDENSTSNTTNSTENDFNTGYAPESTGEKNAAFEGDDDAVLSAAF